MTDPLGREAVGQTRIVGLEFRLIIRSDLSEEELSVTFYHEILEAAVVASPCPPSGVMDFNEGSFEQAARACARAMGLRFTGNA